MPRGITAAIYEGKDVTRDEFLMRVARSFSLAIMQREDDPGAPLKRDEGDTKYHDEKIAEAQALLAELDGLSINDAQVRAVNERAEAEVRMREGREGNVRLRSRYEAMIREVEAWEPEPLVAYLKEGALKQLRDSIDFDCGKPGEELKYWPVLPPLDASEWLNQKREKARKDIEYHREQKAKRQKIADERNEHIDAFYRSIGSGITGA